MNKTSIRGVTRERFGLLTLQAGFGEYPGEGDWEKSEDFRPALEVVDAR